MKKGLAILLLLAALAALVFLGSWLSKDGSPAYTGQDRRKSFAAAGPHASEVTASPRAEQYANLCSHFFGKLPLAGPVQRAEATNVFVRYHTNRQGRAIPWTAVATKTHLVSFVGGRLSMITSLDQGSDTRRNPDATNDWWKAAGTWDEASAIRETLRAVERLGYKTNMVSAVAYRATPITVRKPGGTPSRLAPFHTVDLLEADGDSVGSVEWRMGSNGPAGITRFSAWPITGSVPLINE